MPLSTSDLASSLGLAAREALVEEAALPGKPGLVCPGGPGAHEDMDFALMLASARALEPWFAECAALSLSFPGDDPRLLFEALRAPGMGAEKAMFAATGGVNTHKGALFTLGLLVAAYCLCLRGPAQEPDRAPEGGAPGTPGLAERVLAQAARMAGGLEAELGAAAGTQAAGVLSAGLRLHRALGLKGVRGEASAGYPVLAARVLPPLRKARGGGGPAREGALIKALLGAMCDLEDSCVVSRGGLEGLAFLRAGAAEVLGLWTGRAGGAGGAGGAGRPALAALARLDAELVARRLSPGGSADLLAAGIFLDRLETEEGRGKAGELRP